MKRNVGTKTVYIFRNLLKKKFEEAMKKVGDTFRHDFSYEKPYFELTIRVDAYDFATSVMETEILGLTRKLARAEEKIKSLEAERYEVEGPVDINKLAEESQEPITEEILEFGERVVSHQKKGEFHRLVLCCKPPQKVSEWVVRLQPAELGDFVASWDKVEEIPF